MPDTAACAANGAGRPEKTTLAADSGGFFICAVDAGVKHVILWP